MGFTGRTWHHFDLELGAANTTFDRRDARDEAVAGVGARIVANSRYRRAGFGASTAGPGQWTSASFRGLLNDGAVRGAYFNVDSLVVGRYFRDYGDLDAAGRGVDGQGALVGLGSLYDYDVRELPFAWDRTASVGIVGPVTEIEMRRGLVALRARFAVAYAFGQITSLAYARTKAAFADVIIKSELKDHGYYYAQGIAYDGAVELESGDFRLAFAGRGGTYWSFDFADTNQSRIQNNFSLRDTRLFLRTAASLQPGGGPVRIAIELDDDIRESSIPGAAFSSVEQRLLGSALLVF